MADWSNRRDTTQLDRPQNSSCAEAFAAPPALSTAIAAVLPSCERRTSYSAPEKAAYSARTALCAATHGVPAAA